MAKKPETTASAGKSDVVTIHDQKLSRGEGGELHQTAEGDAPVLTTAQGGPVADDQNTLRVGPRGPLVMDDFHF
ncbi:catalase HPII, partial [bacterium M00.F.Ca.ET.230.01.1.1]